MLFVSHVFCRLYTRRTIVRRELARTRANSRELGRTPREFASSSPTPTLRRTPPNVRRSTPNVRRSSAEFARVRPSSRVLRRELANGSPENSFAGRNLNQRSPRTRSAANVVRRERGSSRTTFAANDNFGELVRQKLLENADYSSLSRTSSPPANCCSPRTTVRCELMFAGGELMFVGHRKPNLKSYRENGRTAPAAEEPLKSRLRTV